MSGAPTVRDYLAVVVRHPDLAARAARQGFRMWRGERPFWAGFWTVLGAALMLLSPLSAIQVVVAGSTVWSGIVVGGVVLICGLMLWFEPQLAHFLGSVTILLSLVSFATNTFGGFLLGMVFGLCGGALALAWVAAAPAAAAVGLEGRAQARTTGPAASMDPAAPVHRSPEP